MNEELDQATRPDEGAPPSAPGGADAKAVERFSAKVMEAVARAEGEDVDEVVAEYESRYYGSGGVTSGKAGAGGGAKAASGAPKAPPPPPEPPRPQRAVAPALGAGGLAVEDERLWAMLAHATVPLTLVLSLVSAGALLPLLIFAPLAIYFVYRERSRFVAYHALQAFVMQLVGTFGLLGVAVVGGFVLVLGIVVSGVLSFVLVGIPFLILFVLALVVFGIAVVVAPFALAIYALVAAVETYNGRNFRYKWIADWVDRYAGGERAG